ncbi:MAG: hypothetical protein AAB295_08955 [Chloroflexota bacterium]
MDDHTVESTLAACERTLAADAAIDLKSSGFWRAVAAVKRRPDLVARFADQIARIDRAAFERSVPLRIGASLGVAVLAAGAAVGLAILTIAPRLEHPLRDLAVLAGAGALDAVTHGLAHVIVGATMGIRFTHAFVELPRKPQPGFKIDYATYLRTPARARAWMHASGAIATKLTPFAVLLYALAIGTDLWAIAVLAALGALQIATDLLLSAKASDWKKFDREMKLARDAP